MSGRLNECQEIQLEALLDADEDSDLFRNAASHVDACPECRRRLTEACGDAPRGCARTRDWFRRRRVA